MALLGINKQRAFGQMPPQMSPLQAYGDGSTPAMMQQPQQMPQQQQQQPRFKPNVLGVIGDAMQVFGGGQATYMQGVREQQERSEMMRQRAMQSQQDRETKWQDYVREAEYDRANPKAAQPTEFERILQASGLPQPEQVKLMQDFARNRANPVQGVPYTDEAGNTGLKFIRPNMQAPQAPPEFAGWADEDEGGQTQPVSGNFPRQPPRRNNGGY